MTYSNKLQHAGGEPYDNEKDRLPHRVFVALRTKNEDYKQLAQVRWLGYQLHDDIAYSEAISEEVEMMIFGIVDPDDNSFRNAIDIHVKQWLRNNATTLIEEEGIDEAEVEEALAEYGAELEETQVA